MNKFIHMGAPGKDTVTKDKVTKLNITQSLFQVFRKEPRLVGGVRHSLRFF